MHLENDARFMKNNLLGNQFAVMTYNRVTGNPWPFDEPQEVLHQVIRNCFWSYSDKLVGDEIVLTEREKYPVYVLNNQKWTEETEWVYKGTKEQGRAGDIRHVEYYNTYDLMKISHEITLKVTEKEDFYRQTKNLSLAFDSPFDAVTPTPKTRRLAPAAAPAKTNSVKVPISDIMDVSELYDWWNDWWIWVLIFIAVVGVVFGVIGVVMMCRKKAPPPQDTQTEGISSGLL